MGGRKKRGTDLTHHVVQAFLAKTRSSGVSSALFFLDLHSAFYAVMRQFLFSEGWTDRTICWLLQTLGIDQSELHEFRRFCQEEDATQTLHPHGVQILRDVFHLANFQMRGVQQIGIPRKGTRPGDPVGDVCFNLLMSSMIKEHRRSVASDDVQWLEGDHLQQTACFYDVSFVDDVCVMISHPDNSQLVPLAQQIATSWCAVARKRGLLVNFKEDKTELMVMFRGKGSRELKTATFVQQEPVVNVADGNVLRTLRLVHSYKHLGTYLQADAKPVRDVEARISRAKQAWGPLCRPFFLKKEVQVDTKLQIFRALVMSRHLFHTYTWSWVPPVLLDRWHNAIKPMICPLVKQSVGRECVEILDVFTLCGLIWLPAPKDLLAKSRLLYLKRALIYGPATLWSLLHGVDHAHGWLAHLQQDLHWFLDFHSSADDMPPVHDVRGWLQCVKQCQTWGSMVRKAAATCMRFRYNEATGKLWEKRMAAGFRKFGVEVESIPSAHQWQCNLCDKSFGSKRALAMHSHQVHGYRPLPKYYANGSMCWICAKEYHARPRLVHHLMYSTSCVDKLRQLFPPLSDEAVQQLDEEDSQWAKQQQQLGWSRYKAHLPAIRVPFAMLPAPGSPAGDKLFADWAERFGCGGNPFLQLDGRTNSEEDSSAPSPHPAFVMQSYGGPESGYGGVYDYKGVSVWDCRVSLRCIAFVHFYSGYRRRHDLHHCIENQTMIGSLQVFCLSVDLCLDQTHGDLMVDANQQWWLDRVASRQVFGGGGGSPCETFSAARMLENGPPPLRDEQHPFGKKLLTKKQSKQVAVGNMLLFFIMRFLQCIASAGGCGFAEHPQFPTWMLSRSPASIWRLTPVQWFRKLACASFISFDQCTVGGPSVKPTTLLLVRLGQTRAFLRSQGDCGRCAHGPGAHKALGGREGDSFATAKAKIYPHGLNRAIAEGICGYLKNTLCAQGCTEDFPSVFCPYRPTDFRNDDVVQPDYHGG